MSVRTIIEANVKHLLKPSKWDDFSIASPVPLKFKSTKFSMALAKEAIKSPAGATAKDITVSFTHGYEDMATVYVSRKVNYQKKTIGEHKRVPDSEQEVLKAMNELIIRAADPVYKGIDTLLKKMKNLDPDAKNELRVLGKEQNLPIDFDKLTMETIAKWNALIDQIKGKKEISA